MIFSVANGFDPAFLQDVSGVRRVERSSVRVDADKNIGNVDAAGLLPDLPTDGNKEGKREGLGDRKPQARAAAADERPERDPNGSQISRERSTR